MQHAQQVLVAGAAMAIEGCCSGASVGTLRFRKNCGSHIDASHSRQPLVKGERLVRYEVNAVMLALGVSVNPGESHVDKTLCIVVLADLRTD